MGLTTVFRRFKNRLSALSFRMGVIVALCCLLSYVISFAQMALPLSAGTKVVLWTIFFGCAKALQYTAVLILGTAGLQKLKAIFRRKKA